MTQPSNRAPIPTRAEILHGLAAANVAMADAASCVQGMIALLRAKGVKLKDSDTQVAYEALQAASLVSCANAGLIARCSEELQKAKGESDGKPGI